MAEFKRFGPFKIFGEFDEDENWIKYDRPHFDLFVEALGTDGKIHSVQVRVGSDLLDHPGLEENSWLMLERVLHKRMVDRGLWVD